MEKIFGDQNSGESGVMATILQLKVTKRRLFEKVSLECWVVACNDCMPGYFLPLTLDLDLLYIVRYLNSLVNNLKYLKQGINKQLILYLMVHLY